MKPDEFEQQLQRQPLRAIPSGWRTEILQQAKAAAARSSSQVQASPRPGLPTLAPALSWWREWLWPCPQAWVGLAGIWIILLAVHFVARPLSPPSSVQTAPPSPETQMALSAQRREMTRLLDGSMEPPAAPKRSVPGPRSDRMSPSKA